MNKILWFLLWISLSFCACNSKTPPTQIMGEGLGTYYKIIIAEQNDITKLQVDSIIKELNNVASVFYPHSLVAKINRNETDTLNHVLKELLEMSLQVCEETEGAFDFTTGALINLWGFGKDAQKEISHEDVENALNTVGFQKIKIEGNKIIKENPDTQLNFNAIAKGYCVDLVAAFLISKGLQNFLIDIGGELYVSGERAPNQKWRVGIQKPTENKDGLLGAETIMELQNVAIATSGNYRNYIEEDGKRHGHIINPQTGYPETNDLLSVTTLTCTCALADAYATALMVMGEEKAQTFAEQHPDIKVYLIAANEE